jgi:excinuclease ABC subunit A
MRVVQAVADDLKFSLDTPWRALPERAKEALLFGQNYKVHVTYRNRYGRDRSYTTGFEGVVPFVKRRTRRDRLRVEPGALRGLHA